jgi:type III restriction enzyme
VEVTGKELDNEGMIKMPLNIDPRQGTDWKTTLNAALERLKALEREAVTLRSDTGRYIRPIMLIQVERTGKDQRESGRIHALDVKDWLQTAGFDEAEIAIKTAETNDLNQPENQNLLAPTNRVRAIITKQALQEGWDCPFAYVLCSLAASGNLKAMTQLVGRILRQPDALRIGDSLLDECYVVTHHAGTGEVVKAIKEGLEQDGLADLVLSISQDAPINGAKVQRKIKRRTAFAKTDIYLPMVLRVEDGDVRPLDYETDVLAAIDWRGFDPSSIALKIPENAQATESQLQRITLTGDGEHFALQTLGGGTQGQSFDPAYAARVISDLVPNPFVGREILGGLLRALHSRGFGDEKIGKLSGLIVDELRRGLDHERTTRAERFFKAAVKKGDIQFRLRLDSHNWRMPFETETMEPEKARQLFRDDEPLAKSLFSPLYDNDFNSDERDVAIYLDSEQALIWWHRNVARSQYGLQGWRRAKIYPDFLFAVQRASGKARVTVLETKGDQLDNLDTAYKRDVLRFLTTSFSWELAVPVGTLAVLKPDGTTVEGELILMSEWKSRLPEYLK